MAATTTTTARWTQEGCGANEFCRLKTGTCGQIVLDDGAGTTTGACFAMPESCPDSNKPVCGCDGVTYDNPCSATMAGQSLAFKRPCEEGDDAAGGEEEEGGGGEAGDAGKPCDATAAMAGVGGEGAAQEGEEGAEVTEEVTEEDTAAVAVDGSSSAPSPSAPSSEATEEDAVVGSSSAPSPTASATSSYSLSVGGSDAGSVSTLDATAVDSSSSPSPSSSNSTGSPIATIAESNSTETSDVTADVVTAIDSSSSPSNSTGGDAIATVIDTNTTGASNATVVDLSASSSSTSNSTGADSNATAVGVTAGVLPTEEGEGEGGDVNPAENVNYNSRAALCPGHEGTGLMGYSNLASLIDDILDYHASFVTPMPTYSPTVTSEPTTTTRMPTYEPTLVGERSVSPTTGVVTYAPITFRPTEYPTSSIREPKEPTRSPAPTILPFIIGLVDPDGDGVNGTNGTSTINITALALAGGGLDTDGDGTVSEGETFSIPEDAGVDMGSLNPTVSASPLFAFLAPSPASGGTMPPGTTSPPAGGGTMPPGTTPPPAVAGSTPPQAVAGPTLSPSPTSVLSAVDDASSSAGNTLDEFMNDRRRRRRRAQDNDDGATLSLTFTTSNSTGASNVTAVNASAAAPASSAASAETRPPKVTFQICPDTKLSFTDTFSLVESPPIILETPARHPIDIICLSEVKDNSLSTTTPTTATETLKGGSCVMSGGAVHILIEHVPHTRAADASGSTLPSAAANTVTAGEGEMSAGQVGHPINIWGITFRGASNTSILMNDPRGNITFRNCSWEDNVGEATMVIDGRYIASTTEDHDDDGNDEVGAVDLEGELDPLYPDEEPIVDDGTDDLIIDFDNPEDMTVSFESTSTSSTMSFDKMTSTVANDSYDDDSTFEQEDSAVEGEPSSTSSTIANDIETETGSTAAGGSATLPGGFEFNLDGNRWLGLLDDGSIEEDEGLSSISDMEDLEEGTSMRAMQSLEIEEVTQRSNIFVEGCSFRGDKGNATVLLSSYVKETKLSEEEANANLLDDLLNDRRRTRGIRYLQAYSNPRLTHSIHLVMKMTSFISNHVDTSIIENYGGRLQLSNCAFINNTAESIIRSEDGIVAIASTEFSGNDVRGNGSQIVLDSESALEANDDNCVAATDDPLPGGGDGNTNVTSASARSCIGINAGGVCSVLKPCIVSTSVSEQMGPCFSDWDELVVAIRDRPSTERDFIICPGSTLTATTAPVVIDGNYINIQCGTEWDKDCVISGGYSHFHIVGSSKGVQLARLTMSGATGSSIMALGNKGATLNLQDCEWIKNEGGSAILIHNEQIMKLPEKGPLDIIQLLSSSPTAAMSVDVIDCVFASNTHSFGAIANIGGTLTVSRSRFIENSGLGGEIVVTNYGNSEVRESCFNSASSMAPGTIFIQDGSSIRNKDNFGFQNTAGGYGNGSSCVDVFLEMKDVNCLVDGTMDCNGVCEPFTSAACPVDTGDNIRVPHYNNDEESYSSNIVPIIVAAIVCAFIVFGFIGIIMRRRKVLKRESDGEQSGGRGICCCKRNNGYGGDNNDEEMEDFDIDENVP